MRLDLGAIAKAGTSKANQTGGWRNFKPIFHQEKCVGCGLCKIYCPLKNYLCFPVTLPLPGEIKKPGS